MATPAISWHGTNGNNITQGRAGHKVIAICNHIMVGSIESADNWFKADGSGASAHFGIAKDGIRTWQWVDEGDMAWANGVVNAGPATPQWVRDTLPGGINAGVNVNNLTISIEHEGQPGDQILELQYQASLALQRYLVAKYGIAIDRDHIIGHYQIDGKNRPNCPGPNYPWKRLLADLAAVVPFDPNPHGLNVGPGMLAKLTEIRETALSAEQYYNPNHGQPPGLTQRSFLWTEQGSMLLAIQDLKPDNTPVATWTVQHYRHI